MSKHNVYRDGKIHVMSEECKTCIFRPATRPVDGKRVAEMVTDTMNEPGATVICHSTLYGPEPAEHAICRGWYDRLGDRDPILLLAQQMELIQEQELP